jgi:uncharacterized protein YyaL (SSP411 family)
MPNRLATAQSLYLRKHADNPIDWWPWCPEALAKAQAEDKPIFLSVGYSSCHWCTVMEGEAFSDPAIADYMNAQFLPIKIDREERPDLDSIYMTALQAMTGQGGWPMNLFLSPDDLIPFYGGTYFPVEPRYGRPGFLQILQAVRNFYDAEKTQLAAQKQKLLSFLHNTTQLEAADNLSFACLQTGFDLSCTILSRQSPGPSFPMMPYALLALQGNRFQPVSEEHSPALQRGLDLALGGIYDHVAGGFHRYTVDPTWTVPHFEKMLYDNGQILEFLANLWEAGYHQPPFARAIAGTVQWLQREMIAPEGYFYAAQDADNFVQSTAPEPEEGRFYSWSYAELEQLLTASDLAALQQAFHITAEGNFEQGLIVLQRQQQGVLSESVEQALAKLFQIRYGRSLSEPSPFPPARNNTEAKQTPWPGRIPPVTDTKMILSWNSLMISGLARAAAVLQNADYLAIAHTATQFILNHQWMGDQLHRLYYDGQVAVPAQAEDYAFFVKALLDLHQAALLLGHSDIAHTALSEAMRIQHSFDEHLWALDGGGYYTADRSAAPELIIQERGWMDNATPSANGIAIANLIRLTLATDTLTYLNQAEQALRQFGSLLETSPSSCPSLFSALDWYLHCIVVRTGSDNLPELRQHPYWPTVHLAVASDLPVTVWGLVCEGLKCLAPLPDAATLTRQVQLSLTRHLAQTP